MKETEFSLLNCGHVVWESDHCDTPKDLMYISASFPGNDFPEAIDWHAATHYRDSFIVAGGTNVGERNCGSFGCTHGEVYL